MGLSRRQFTKEFKLAAVRRLEQGVSIGGAADAAGTDWKSAVYRKVQEEVKADSRLTIERMVELGGVSRASFYRYDEDAALRPDRDMDLRDAIQRIALEWPSYGRPRITAALRREGWI